MGKGRAATGAAKGLFAPIEKWLRKNLRKGGRHHVFRGEIRRGRGGAPKASGWHHRFQGVDPPDRRVVQVTRRDASNAYHADVEFKGPNGQWLRKDAGSTFFPDNWTPQEVKRAIDEAYTNGSPVPGTGNRRWRGYSNGIVIEGSYHPNGKRWNSGWPLIS